MPLNITREIAVLQRMTVKQLRQRYAEAFGEPTLANNRPWLIKRIAWRLQALAEGDLSDRARARAAELANDADLRTTMPKQTAEPAPVPEPEPERTVTRVVEHDPRLPPVGTVLTRHYKGRDVQVHIAPDGLVYDGKVYPSLSAAAKAITGSHMNGFLFFKLTKPGAST